MTGKTHRVGGVLCCLGGYVLLENKGMLISDVSPLVQLVVMYPFAIYGSVVSDLDHNKNSIPCRDIVSRGINSILHLTTKVREKSGKSSFLVSLFDAKHRSWQTHSDLFLWVMLFAMSYILGNYTNSVDQIIMKIVMTGLVLGVISHLFLDMLTPEGIWCFLTCLIAKVTKYKKIPKKIHFVPNTSFFRTGGAWEDLIRNIMWVICVLLMLHILISISPYSIDIRI